MNELRSVFGLLGDLVTFFVARGCVSVDRPDSGLYFS